MQTQISVWLHIINHKTVNCLMRILAWRGPRYGSKHVAIAFIRSNGHINKQLCRWEFHTLLWHIKIPSSNDWTFRRSRNPAVEVWHTREALGTIKQLLLMCFMFMWPCIVTNFFIIKPTRCTNFTNLFCHETLHVSDSSSVHHQEFIHYTLSNGICHTGL